MVKKVNVTSKAPIYGITKEPIVGKVYGIELSSNQIYNCFCKGAIVEEVLSTGELIVLGGRNYNTVNEAVVTMPENIVDNKAIEDAAKAKAEADKKAEEAALAKKLEDEKAAAEKKRQDEAAAKKKADEAKKKAEDDAKKKAEEDAAKAKAEAEEKALEEAIKAEEAETKKSK
jgi:flagellar biosynthesis GTPase FlhF